MATPVIRADAPERAAAESDQAEHTAVSVGSPIAAISGVRRVPTPVNEAVRPYAPGSPERAELKARLKQMANERIEIPLVIGGEEVRTGELAQSVMPHDHKHVLADWHKARRQDVLRAVEAARKAQVEWANWPWEDRAAVLLRAAELLATRWRATLNAATMLGQSKTVFQAEIDSACELIDFWRFNPAYAQDLYEEQPLSVAGMWNQMDYRPLEGFIYAVTPFNFTAIGGNLPTAPALMGNTVVWKPASTAMLSAYYIMKLLEEAGLPPGVVNLVPGDAAEISDVLLSHRDLAGVHFTGSTNVFNSMWKTIGANMSRYASYPRIVGETGGKDFIVAHPSADAEALAVAIVRDFRNFVSAVIDKRAFDKISGYVDDARKNAKVIAGGKADDKRGYFIEPTFVEAHDPGYRLLCEEIFGPVVSAYVYDDARWEETLRIVDTTSPYALTGSVFANERRAVLQAVVALRNAAGNFYINDKPTGAVVGQQPFGGARGSGTNDKAGSKLNLVRWVSPRTIKETFPPPRDYRYPFMAEE